MGKTKQTPIKKTPKSIEEDVFKKITNRGRFISTIQNVKVHTPVNSMIETELLKWIIRTANPSGRLMTSKVSLLEGPPGVGKTYSLKKSIDRLRSLSPFRMADDEDLEKIKKETNKLIEAINKTDENLLDVDTKRSLVNTLNSILNDDNYKLLKILGKEVISFLEENLSSFSQHINELRNLNLLENDIEMAKRYIRGTLSSFVLDFNRVFLRLNNMEETKMKIMLESLQDIKLNLIVLPSLSSPQEVISSPMFLQGSASGNFIEKKTMMNILHLIFPSLTGNPVVLVLDEMTELIKNSRTRNIKNLHDFLDAVVNKSSNEINLVIPLSEIIEDDIKLIKSLITELKNLKENPEKFEMVYPEKEVYEKLLYSLENILNSYGKTDRETDKLINIKIPLNNYLYVFGTGNIRDENSPVGLFDSTKNRTKSIRIDYPPPYQMRSFINEITDKLSKEIINNTKNESIKNKIIEFSEAVSNTYEYLYKSYHSKNSNFRNLPSYRTIVHILTNYSLFLINMDAVNDYLKKIIKRKRNIEFTVIGGSDKINIKTNRGELNNKIINERTYGNFLIYMLKINSILNVSSFTFQSEAEFGSREEEIRINEEVKKHLNNLINIESQVGKPGGSIYEIKFGNRNLYYNKNMVNYIAYLVVNLGINKKPFTLFFGTTQEGKTTMAKFLTSEIFKGNLNIYVISHEDFSIESSNLIDREGKNVNEPRLLKIIREAKENKDKIYVVVINEIDNKTFTQSMNSLLENGEIDIDGEKIKLNNLLIIGTMNVSPAILDNFLSRSGLALLFFPSISSLEIQGMDLSSYFMICDEVEKLANRGGVDGDKIIGLLNDVLSEIYPNLSTIPKRSEISRIISEEDFFDDWNEIISLINKNKEEEARNRIYDWLKRINEGS